MKTTHLFLVFFLLLAACAPVKNDPAGTAQPNLPNPASVYCEEQGYKVEIRTNADGSQSGVCVFDDGSECDEFAFYRGECKPGDEPAASDPSAEGELARDGCKIYRNEALGYSFHYPADAAIINNADPLQSFSVVGPLVGGESWPQFMISHPADREEYRPPQDVDLLQWLTDHNLISDTMLPDLQIAGETAVHFRHDRSPQSYAYDRYFFAHAGQLYMILIGHPGDKEDWDLYNHFLSSFTFGQ